MLNYHIELSCLTTYYMMSDIDSAAQFSDSSDSNESENADNFTCTDLIMTRAIIARCLAEFNSAVASFITEHNNENV